MIHLRRLLFLIALAPGLVLAGNPCSLQPAQDGIGGTGLLPVQDGIGGTGNRQDGIGGTGMILHWDGIGGTGAEARDEGIGGTGIVGIITGFASVCVNGIEVQYDNSTAVTVNGEPGSATQLGVGQVVSISAHSGKNGYKAGSIAVQYAVSGPIRRISPTGQLDVLGQWIEPTARAFRDDLGRLLSPDQIKPGMPVLVSGLRSPDGRILASRIERTAKPVKPQVMGTLKPVAGNVYRIGTLDVRLPPNQSRPSGPVFATLAPDGLAIMSVKPVGKPADISRIVMQGIVQQRTGNLVQLEQGLTIRLAADTKIRGGDQGDLVPGRLVKVSADLRNHDNWHADDLEFQTPHDLSRRGGSDRPHKEGRSGGSSSTGASSGNASTLIESDSISEKIDDVVEQSELATGDQSDGVNQSAVVKLENSSSSKPENKYTVEIEKLEQTETSSRAEISEHVEKMEKPEKVEKRERAERSERFEKVERVERPETVERVERVERPESVEKVERVERPETIEKVERIERPETVEKVERVERPESVEKVERVERPETIEKVERVERPETIEKVERVERPESVDKVERVERPEKLEKVERVERPEKVEHGD